MNNRNQIFLISKVKQAKSLQNQSKIRKIWSKQEDELILNLSKSLPRKDKWILIAKKLKSKTPLECYRRLKSIDPKFKKGRWTPQEDYSLLQLVNQFGRCWNIISKVFKNRSNKQVKIRYDEYINPKISAGKFSIAEDDLILKLYPVYLNKWSKYQAYLTNRSQKRIKLRFISLSCKAANNVAAINSDYSCYRTTSSDHNNSSFNFKILKKEEIRIPEISISEKLF